MTPRLAARVRVVSWLVTAAAAAAAGLVAQPRAAAPTHVVEIHAKLRPGASATAAVGGPAHIAPLFAPGASPALARWRRISVTTTRPDEDIAADFAADAAFEEAFVAPVVSLPRETRGPAGDESCPIATPSFESYQGYLGPAPQGIDAPAAWRRGSRGGGEQFADIEGGWNAAHEDLVGERIAHIHGSSILDRGWRAHGTAVLGEVVGKDNGRGVVGIAPDVDRVFTSSIFGSDVAPAIEAAAEALRPGDVLLIELQATGPRRAYIPVEYWDDVFEAIQDATRRGVVVIEAAGNGGEDLDHAAYRGRFDRKKRDSGAILVGAGGPPRDGYVDRARLEFSNYGGRVDVQGWGRKVATLDYGDLQACADATDRHYTGEFSGTSSASPIVAGAALLVEGAARSHGKVLPPAELRALLIRSGTPQVGDLKEHIGPRPNLERALSQR